MTPNWTHNINTIVFDVDGTLIDSTEAIIESTNHTLQRMGKPPFPPDFIRSKIGYRLEDALGDWEEWEKAEMLRLNHDYYQTICLEKTLLKEGAYETVRSFHERGYRMGVATGKQRGITSMILDHLRLLPFMETVVGSDDVTRMKPDPETLLKALERLNTPPAAAVYVGDTVIDIQASRNAGVRCISVLGGTDSEDALRGRGPDRMIRSLSELSSLFPEGPTSP
jgi:pyrophosphatase PpaX